MKDNKMKSTKVQTLGAGHTIQQLETLNYTMLNGLAFTVT